MPSDDSLVQARPRGSTLVLSLFLALLSATPVWAWGGLDHCVIARVKEKSLDPKAKAAVAAPLEAGEKPNHIAEPLASVNVVDSVPTALGEKNVNGVPVLTTIHEYVNPKHVAVMVVDMQNEIVSTEGGYWRKDRRVPANPDAHRIEPSYQELVENIRRFLAEARRQGIPIIYTEYIHRDANGKMLVNGPECWTHRNADWVSCAVAGTWEAKTIRELAPRPGDLVIRKARANSFYNTYLDDILKEKSIRTLLLTGTAGGGCVFATAMGALERGYYAVFVRDAVTQREYLESDLIRGRFPIYTAQEVRAAWSDDVAPKPREKPKVGLRSGAPSLVNQDTTYPR
jgi:nicotinamidase-related amidase